MSLTQLKKQLKSMSKEEIIGLISNIYKKVPKAKDFFDVFATSDVNGLMEKYQKEIERLVYPKGNNFNTKEVEARKLIRNVRKMKTNELSIAIELLYVNCCIKIVENFDFWDEN